MWIALRLVLLAVAFGAASAGLGWWTVPMLALAWGYAARPGDRPGRVSAVAAAAGWAALLLWTATRGPVVELADKVGGVLSVPGWVLFGVTLLFPAVLAGSAATLGRAVRDGQVVKRER